MWNLLVETRRLQGIVLCKPARGSSGCERGAEEGTCGVLWG